MTRVQLVVIAILAVLVGTSATVLHHQAEFDAQRQSAPPHVALPKAGVKTGPLPVWVSGADPEGNARAVDDWLRFVAGVQERERAEAEARRLVEIAAEEAARAAAIRPAVPRAPTVSGGGSCDGIAWVIPVAIVWNESRCDFGAVNPTGCGGWTCVGAYQFDLRHWLPRGSGGWGTCADLGDWRVPESQHSCARRLPLSAWG